MHNKKFGVCSDVAKAQTVHVPEKQTGNLFYTSKVCPVNVLDAALVKTSHILSLFVAFFCCFSEDLLLNVANVQSCHHFL